jgi:hypothetical protein
MFDGLKRLYRKIATALDAPPDSVDERRPQRVDPDPPKNDGFARVRERSLEAAAKKETAALDALDAMDPRLPRETAAQVEELLAKAERATLQE